MGVGGAESFIHPCSCLNQPSLAITLGFPLQLAQSPSLQGPGTVPCLLALTQETQVPGCLCLGLEEQEGGRVWPENSETESHFIH